MTESPPPPQSLEEVAEEEAAAIGVEEVKPCSSETAPLPDLASSASSNDILEEGDNIRTPQKAEAAESNAQEEEAEDTVGSSDNDYYKNKPIRKALASWSWKFNSPSSSFGSFTNSKSHGTAAENQDQHCDEKKDKDQDDNATTTSSLASDDEDGDDGDKKLPASNNNTGTSEGDDNNLTADNLNLEEMDPETLEQNQKLDQAFLALERMRVANVELELGKTHINPNHCVHCLRERQRQKRDNVRLTQRSWIIRKGIPCLVCGTPTCSSKHASESHQFKEQQLTVCCDCSSLFGLDFIMDLIHLGAQNPEYRRRAVQKVIDSYDRALLILKYSSQFIDATCENLDKQSAIKNKVGLGSSSVGLMSGITGVAAAAIHAAAVSTAVAAGTAAAAVTVLTPIGPPLLIASIVFGGTAMATSTGSEAVSYYSEPNLLADRIMALHELVNSLLRVSVTLRDALVKGHIDLAMYVEHDDNREKEVMERTKDRLDRLSSSSSTARLGSFMSDEGGEKEKDCETETDQSCEKQDNDTNASETDLKSPPPSSISAAGEQTESQNDNSNEKDDVDDLAEIMEDVDLEENDGDSTSDSNSVSSKKSGDGDSTDEKKAEETRLVTTKESQTQALFQAATRSATLTMKAASMASAAFGVFSVASVILEAKNMSDTVERMKKGNKHPKVDILRAIKDEIGKLPDTALIAEQCESYLEYAVGQDDHELV